MRKLLVTLVLISVIFSTLSPTAGAKGEEKGSAHIEDIFTQTHTYGQKITAKEKLNGSSHPGSPNSSILDGIPSRYKDAFAPSLGNNHASKSGAAESVRTEQQRKNRRLDDCCLTVGQYDNNRESLEKAFAKRLKEEPFNLKQIKFLVVTESPHVLNSLKGKAGIPEANLIDSNYGSNRATLLNRIASFPVSDAREPIEITIIASHDAGEISLISGEKIRTEELKTRAKEKGILLNIWGCNSGWDAAHGITGEFDYGALSSAIGNALRENPETRAQFLNSLSSKMDVKFAFDVLAYNEELRIIKANLISMHDKATELEKMFNHFEVTGPKSYNPCNPPLSRRVVNQIRPQAIDCSSGQLK